MPAGQGYHSCHIIHEGFRKIQCRRVVKSHPAPNQYSSIYESLAQQVHVHYIALLIGPQPPALYIRDDRNVLGADIHTLRAPKYIFVLVDMKKHAPSKAFHASHFALPVMSMDSSPGLSVS